MSEAYIIDAIRTPRGKGKKDGSLHEVKPITLLTTLLNELKDRHHLDTSKVDDIVWGVLLQLQTKVVILQKLRQLRQVGTMMLLVCKSTVSVLQVLKLSIWLHKKYVQAGKMWLSQVVASRCHVLQWVQMVGHGH